MAQAIPYVNDVPHVGHAMEYILSDALTRYHRQRGYQTFYSTGTDEHGGKVMEKAASLGISPKRYADQISQSFKDLCTVLNIDYTKFIRTTDKDHEARSQLIWQKLAKYIYRGTYIGMYDTKEEEFLTLEDARQLKEADPERYARLEKIEEENYFFKLSAFNDEIKKLIESGHLQIVPDHRKHEILALLEKGLEDISVSRPKSKIPWGIAVPGDDEQTMYVWVEALLNYITTLEYPDGEAYKTFWPVDTHIIGKDILRFHAAIWPAMLLALGVQTPKRIYVHGFVTMNGKKMSKSLGNVVAPLEIISGYGADAMRYYFLRHIPSMDDGDFTWERFEAAYNSELGDDLGNLVQRTASMINRYQNGVIGDIPPGEHDIGPYDEAFAELRFDKALDYVWGLIRGLNQYIETEKPWELAKKGDEEHLREVLAHVAGSLLQVANLLWPALPKTAQDIRGIFESGVIKNYGGVLFPKVHNYTAE